MDYICRCLRGNNQVNCAQLPPPESNQLENTNDSKAIDKPSHLWVQINNSEEAYVLPVPIRVSSLIQTTRCLPDVISEITNKRRQLKESMGRVERLYSEMDPTSVNRLKQQVRQVDRVLKAQISFATIGSLSPKEAPINDILQRMPQAKLRRIHGMVIEVLDAVTAYESESPTHKQQKLIAALRSDSFHGSSSVDEKTDELDTLG